MMSMKRIFLAAVVALLPLAAFAQSGVMFSYQGRVKVSGEPFTGTGQFKFSIVNTSATATLWSHDGTGAVGNEPDTSIEVPVQDGIFNVIIGDPSAGMQTLNPSVFTGSESPALRVWFSDGLHGFQQLLPDHTLINPDLMSLTRSDEDFTIYVRHSDGNDADNGLTTETAKRTIQAAADVLPERLRSNVTIVIEPGVYREEVMVSGVFVPQGKAVTFLGDSSWTPTAGGTPSVVISARDAGGQRVRTSALRCLSSTRITFQGISFQGATGYCVGTDYSACDFRNCHASDSADNGFLVGALSYVKFYDCLAENSGSTGYRAGPQSSVLMYGSEARGNGFTGLLIDGYSTVSIASPCRFKDNLDTQIWLGGKATLSCLAPVSIVNTGTTARRGISNSWMSMIGSYSQISYSGLFSPALYESRGATHWD